MRGFLGIVYGGRYYVGGRKRHMVWGDMIWEGYVGVSGYLPSCRIAVYGSRREYDEEGRGG